MAVANRYTGENLVIEITPTGGSLTPITADYTSFSWNEAIDDVDITAGNEFERAYLTTKEMVDGTIDMFGGTSAIANAWRSARTGVMTVYPKGKTGGNEYFSFNYIRNGVDSSMAHDAAYEQTFSFKRSGAMLVNFGTTYAAGMTSDVYITAWAEDTSLVGSQEADYKFFVTNSSPHSVNGIEVDFTIDSDFTITGTAVTQGSYATATWDVGTLATGQTAVLTFSLTATGAGDLVGAITEGSPTVNGSPTATISITHS